MTGTMSAVDNQALGKRIERARIEQRYSVAAAASAASISRDTWRKIEKGASVQDTKRAAALALLNLDWDGNPKETKGSVGPPSDAEDELLFRRPVGLSDQEWEQLKQDQGDYWQWQLDKAARER